MQAAQETQETAGSVRPGSLALVALLAPLLLLCLHLRTLDYELVWSDHAEIEHGTLVVLGVRFIPAPAEKHDDLSLQTSSAGSLWT